MTARHLRHLGHRGWTITEIVVTLAGVVVFAGLVVPALAGGRSLSTTNESLQNLTVIGAAHALYAADSGGRQLTLIDDDIASYGTFPQSAFPAYEDVVGTLHPSVMLGWGQNAAGNIFEYQYAMSQVGNYSIPQPLVFLSSHGFEYFGSFRLMNTRPVHAYLGGRFYDEVYYAARDAVVHDVAEYAFDVPWEFTLDLPVADLLGDIPAWSSYCMSPAAMFDPVVMGHPAGAGWLDPWEVPEAFRSPGLFAAEYANLKTFVLEHSWAGTSPIPCNPLFEPGTYAGCEPLYFNHGADAAPATLFYDLSTRLLPNSEVLAADSSVERQTGYGLWSRDTPFGSDGYLIQYGWDDSPLSHHVLTTEGILGRDTTEGASTAGPRAPSDAAPPFDVRRKTKRRVFRHDTAPHHQGFDWNGGS